MDILIQPCGDFGTNCYIIKTNNGEIVIDPGVDSFLYVKQNTTNLLAILATHGHFDHVNDVDKIRKESGAKFYLPKDDEIFILKDPFSRLENTFKADVLVNDKDSFEFGGLKVIFHHFAGHTPGTSMIEIGGVMFSGDFIFRNSIGRTDLYLSDSSVMKQSIQKVLTYPNYTLYPGHGQSTSLDMERDNLTYFLNYL